MRALAILVPLFVLAACGDASGPEASGPDALVGSWVSAGADVAPGLRPAWDSILAAFGEDGAWAGRYYAGSVHLDRTGTYEVGEGDGPIYSITVFPPWEDTIARGIFRVEGDRLQLEWVAHWYADMTPPTVAGGFGSTVEDGFPTGAYWIQIYRRRE